MVALAAGTMISSASAAYVYTIPTGLKGVSASHSSVGLDWKDVSGAPGYRVQYSTSPTMSGALYKRFSSSAATLNDLQPSTTYYVRVAVIDPKSGAKLSDYTQTPYPTVTTVPAPQSGYQLPIPGTLKTSSVTTSSATLSWDAVTGASLYRVQLSTDSTMKNATYHRFGDAGGTLTGLAPHTRYYVRVAVIDPTTGAKVSDYTQLPYVTFTTATAAQNGYALPIPTGLKSVSTTSTSLRLDWDDVSGASKYRVQYSTSASMAGAVYARFNTSDGTLENLSPSTKYYLRVAVIDPVSGAKVSDYTQLPYPTASTAAAPADGYQLPIPTDLTADGVTTSAVSLSWDAVSGASLYRVQLSTSSSMAGATYHRFSKASGSISGLKANTTYYVRVAVIDPVSGAKLSDYTQLPYVTFTTVSSSEYLYPIPTTLSVSSVTQSAAQVEWDPVNGAQMYRVQLSTSSSMAGATYHRFTAAHGSLTGLKATTKYYVRVAVIDPVSGAKLSDYTAKPYVAFMTADKPQPVDLVVGSYNISGVQNDVAALADPSGEMKIWAERKPAVVDTILGTDAAVVGLQEANQSPAYNDSDGRDATPDGDNQFLDLIAGLNDRGGSWDVTNRNFYNCENHRSSIGCKVVDRGASMATRIAYDKSKVSLISQGSVKYAAQSAGKTDRYLAWAVFESKANGHRFFFATTHLDPYSTASRAAEWQQLATEVKTRAAGLPIVVTGDFNASKFHAVAQTGLAAMRSVGVSDVLGQEYQVNPPKKVRAEKVSLGFLNSFNGYVRDLDGDGKCYCTQPKKIGNGIDYVFASDALRVKDFTINARVNTSTWDQIGVIPSDHHMLSSTIVLP